MAGQKLSAKASEKVEFLDYVITQCEHLAADVEQFASAKKSAQADWIRQGIARELGHMRQRAMVRNLGVLADEIGRLAVQAGGGGSPQMKTRMLRDGVAALHAAFERYRKATVDADVAEQKAGKAHGEEGA
jgi:hypothetical protein